MKRHGLTCRMKRSSMIIVLNSRTRGLPTGLSTHSPMHCSATGILDFCKLWTRWICKFIESNNHDGFTGFCSTAVHAFFKAVANERWGRGTGKEGTLLKIMKIDTTWSTTRVLERRVSIWGADSCVFIGLQAGKVTERGVALLRKRIGSWSSTHASRSKLQTRALTQ